MNKIIVFVIITIFLVSCEVSDIGKPEEVYSTGTYYTQTADVSFVVVYGSGSTDTITETISNTRTPMQGSYRHEMEVDGIKFVNIEVDFEDYRLIGTWDDTVDNITFYDDGSYVSSSFGSGTWDTVYFDGIYLNGAGPYYYGYSYDDPDVYITIDTTVDLKKM